MSTSACKAARACIARAELTLSRWSTHVLAARAVSCAKGESGQTLTEYVLASGMLVLLGIALSGIVTRALRVFVSGLMWELTFFSP